MNLMSPLFLILAIALGSVDCANNTQFIQSQANHSGVDEFKAVLHRNPDVIFSTRVDARVRASLSAYAARVKLPNGLTYGESVRVYSLANKSASTIQSDMSLKHCPLTKSVLREPNQNQPVIHQGHTIPLWMFICPDGGVVRIKPEGDPASAYRPQPHGSKALRYPYDSKFENFSDEVVKVDNEGYAVPKSRADLAEPAWVEDWAADAHTDLLRPSPTPLR